MFDISWEILFGIFGSFLGGFSLYLHWKKSRRDKPLLEIDSSSENVFESLSDYDRDPMGAIVSEFNLKNTGDKGSTISNIFIEIDGKGCGDVEVKVKDRHRELPYDIGPHQTLNLRLFSYITIETMKELRQRIDNSESFKMKVTFEHTFGEFKYSKTVKEVNILL